MENKFEKQMNSRTDEELVQIINSSEGDYQLEAVESAKIEIKRRAVIQHSVPNYKDKDLIDIISNKSKYSQFEIENREVTSPELNKTVAYESAEPKFIKNQNIKNKIIRVSIFLIVTILTYFTFGIFVVQPIGAIPEGKTIIYVRIGSNMNFIDSADGILLRETGSVNLFGRGILLGVFANTFQNKILLQLPYSETVYLVSTNGVTFEE